MRFLAITHDQDIDRRILQQINSLCNHGWTGTLICISHNNEDYYEIYNRFNLHRIGLNKIIPSCPVYEAYQQRQIRILGYFYTKPHQKLIKKYPFLSKPIQSIYTYASRSNWLAYKALLIYYYHNRRLFYPLPFDRCFYNAAQGYEADIIVAHDLTALPAGVQLAMERNIPLVYDAHELYYEQQAFSRKQKVMMFELENALIKKCNVTFTVNDSIADEMVKRYSCARPRVLLNAIDLPFGFDTTKPHTMLRRHFGLHNNAVILLFQGGLLRRRNLENLAKSMRYINDPNVVLVFMGNGPLIENLQHLTEQARLQNRILFKPAVPPQEVVNWTASADIGIIPYPPIDLNTYYCTPNKLFEYIQAGVPILANDLPELRRYVKDTGFGLTVNMDNPLTLATAIKNFISDARFLSRTRQIILARQAEFSWDYCSREFVNIINSLIKSDE